MTKIDVQRTGCYVTDKEGNFVELALGVQEVDDKIAQKMCQARHAVAVVEETAEIEAPVVEETAEAPVEETAEAPVEETAEAPVEETKSKTKTK